MFGFIFSIISWLEEIDFIYNFFRKIFKKKKKRRRDSYKTTLKKLESGRLRIR